MARPKSVPGRAPTDVRILDAAAEAFAAAGYAPTTLAEVAREVGIRRPSLLYHFESKAVLYAAVVERTFEELAEALELPMKGSGPFEERLRALVEGFVAFMDDHRSAAALIVREMMTPDGPGQQIIAERGQQMLGLVEAWLRGEGSSRLRPDIDLRRAVMQVASDALLRNAATPAMSALWGAATVDETWALTRATLLHDTEETP